MTQELAKIDKDEEAVHFFDQVSRQVKTPQELAVETAYSLKTIYNRINRGREIIEGEIRGQGSKLIADLWRKYEIIWDEAYLEWKATKNPAFLKQMQSVLEAYRKMLAVDAAPKAPVNEKGEAVQNSMVLVFSETGYAEKEAELAEEEKKAIEGNYTEISDTFDDDSTKVPLDTTE